MKPGDWLAPLRLQRCPECRLQTTVIKRKGRVINRWHTGSGEWVQECPLAALDGVAA